MFTKPLYPDSRQEKGKRLRPSAPPWTYSTNLGATPFASASVIVSVCLCVCLLCLLNAVSRLWLYPGHDFVTACPVGMVWRTTGISSRSSTAGAIQCIASTIALVQAWLLRMCSVAASEQVVQHLFFLVLSVFLSPKGAWVRPLPPR